MRLWANRANERRKWNFETGVINQYGIQNGGPAEELGQRDNRE